ncbi:lytic transglycosylase domain-containing protein [Pseudobacteriovorax antillogorgiicola]|uniref:Membrane-bound lytic murein transglycosylase D n=1 Tax=Pseudobacteriovorax antillogorgiicola TaxID=1513793 RepID=A0A1Y6CC04_9BACT|nr:lytic transglycosylase domain-containing protein [Pseudobacteriovorax antillogorgiicola]TCS49417.1 membrane-bound lytic murein transglycosylase D [Pseudobacteriovorax antillogorgiicola]SMF46903.1 membrane-bound lytic murein transglycosylase D [Pseudobacteriovorax antillogorgiicola]
MLRVMIFSFAMLYSSISIALTMAPANPDGSALPKECQLSLSTVGNSYEILHPQCPQHEIDREGQKFMFADTFPVSGSLSRRVHFWRKIYQSYSIRDYVIHSKEYPELAIEVVRLDDLIDERVKPRRTLRYRIRLAKANFLALAKNKGVPKTQEQERLLNLSEHITDKNKYKTIAHSLRAQRGQKEFFLRGVAAAHRYLPHILPHFEELGIPSELAYIAFVESSFNLKAVSKVGASGVYQIMPFIARKKMILNQSIDERRDPIKSGRIAAWLFHDNLRLTGNWPLAVTAYNHGPFGIRRAIRRVGSDRLEDLISSYSKKRFGFASKNFYAEFIAAAMVAKPLVEGYRAEDHATPLSFRELTLERSTNIGSVLKTYNIDRETLAELNPDILPRAIRSSKTKLPKGFILKLPPEEPSPLS